MKRSVLIVIICICYVFCNAVFSQKLPLGINLEGYAYPYPVHFYSFNSQHQKLKMAYMYETAQNPKGTIVLLHGKNFNGSYWGATMKALLNKGYSVFVPDQIGFGKSSKPPYYQYSFQQLTENTKNILDSLHITRYILWGHSMGGMMAVRFALMFPGNIEQLILEDPIGLEDWKTWVPYRDVDYYYHTELKKTPDVVKQYMLKNYFHNEWRKDYDELVYEQSAYLDSPDYPLCAWNAALTTDMIMSQPVCYEFGNIKVPTVLIIGQLDRTALGKELVEKQVADKMGNYPVLGKETARRIPGCQLVELEGVGHVPHVENFELFINKVLEILKK